MSDRGVSGKPDKRKDTDLVPDVVIDWSDPSSNRRGEDSPTSERLQKVLAAAGVASRRVSEQLIAAGRVTVNGEVVSELGSRVEPASDLVAVDGVAIQLDRTKRYIMFNKPTGVVSSMADEGGKPDLSTVAAQFEERLFNVGRLDAETSGLLLLTNDGPLANVLSHPRYGVEKTYIAKVRGSVNQQTLRKLKEGIELDDGPIAADAARLLGSPSQGHSMVELTLHSGRNRIVRRMLAEVGHPVVELVRRQFGPLHLGGLGLGQTRELTDAERGALLTIARQHSEAGGAAGEHAADRPAAEKPAADEPEPRA
jgi:23S rRNA pseudouridine2605 synthase/16S rRNA pseudouridine516 synthase